MTTIIYSFKNKKPVFYELPRFYKVKSKIELDNLIYKLLDKNIDAVASPCNEDIKYPQFLELEAGFALSLKLTSKDKIKELINKAKELI